MAYPNTTINEGGFGSFQSDTAANVTIGIYIRVKFSTNKNTLSADGKPTLLVAAIGDRGVAVAMQPIAAALTGTVRFLNAEGEQKGIASGSIPVGSAVYTAAAGKFSVVTTGGALFVGYATTDGFDGGPFTWMPAIPAA